VNNNKRIIAVSHCIFNKHSKVESTSPKDPDTTKLLSYLLDKNIGIIQLPCPEMHMYGIKRWGHVKEQFDTPFFRETSRELLKPFGLQVKDYTNNGYDLIGIIGIEGSPSCGAFNTCKGPDWGGEFKDIDLVQQKVSTITYTSSKGVFMEELENMLNSINIEPIFFGLLGNEVDDLINSLSLHLEGI